jgi:hypothetical protein
LAFADVVVVVAELGVELQADNPIAQITATSETISGPRETSGC